MSSDLEQELRRAMVDHNAGAVPGRSLVRDVKRRYHRRLIRLRLGFAALLTAAAVTAIPVYQVLSPGGSHGSREAGHQVGSTPPALSPPPESPSPSSHASPRPSPPIEAPHPPRPSAKPPKAPARPPGNPQPDDVLTLTYVPHATWSAQPCAYAETREGRTTTCQWDAAEGYWVKLEVIQQPELSQPEQISSFALFVNEAQVHGKRALTGGVPFVARSVRWIERPGVGIRISATGPAGTELLRVAEGAHIPS